MEKSLTERNKLFSNEGHMDFVLFMTVMLLCAFGLIMVFSASYYYAQSSFNDGYYYLRSQIQFLVLGIIALFCFSYFDYHNWERLKVPFIVVIMLLMTAVIFWGVERNGARRWLDLFGIVTFQPSELAKFALILYMAAFMARFPQRMESFSHGVVPMLLVIGAISLLVILQRNMSMMVIVLGIGFIMLYIGGAKVKHLLLLGISAVPLLFLLAYLEPYRWERLTIFTNPWKDPKDTGYQLIQSLYALGSGGLFGQGLNFSRQKLLFLTYGESDFIFSIIGEELGFVGCVLVLFAYLFLVYRGIQVAIHAKDRFGSLLAAGIVTVMAMQVAVNVGVATSSLPPTGQTLPFVSAGGTSLFIYLTAMGILLNISRSAKST